MFAQVDLVSIDHIETDMEPRFRFFEDDGVSGVSIGIGNAVVVIQPIEELALKLVEISKS